jgi:hypothetical protein
MLTTARQISRLTVRSFPFSFVRLRLCSRGRAEENDRDRGTSQADGKRFITKIVIGEISECEAP